MYSDTPLEFDHAVKVGIVEGNHILGENLRRAVDASPDTRCVGVWHSAKECLQKIGEARPLLVLMDLDLPGASGIAATAALKRLMPDVQVMIVSLDADPQRISEAIQAGACGYFIKPTPVGGMVSSGAVPPFGCQRTVTEMARNVIEKLHTRGQKTKLDPASEPLTSRETVVVRLIAEGCTNKEIACHMDVGLETVRTHIRTIFRKLNVRSRTEVAVKYLKSLKNWSADEMSAAS
jgi:DNA-binding NarL/FixJ family response regulator